MQTFSWYDECIDHFRTEVLMAFLRIPDTVLVRLYLKTAVAELTASISLYFHRVDYTEEDMEDLLSDLEDTFVTDLMLPLCDDYTAYLLEAYDMNSVDGLKVTRVLDMSGGSPGTETPVSPALCCVVSFRGNKRGKWNAGRNFIPGLYESKVDQVDISTELSDPILLAYVRLIEQPPSGWTWVIASRYFEKEKRTVGVVTPVKAALVRSQRFGVQRRRAQRP